MKIIVSHPTGSQFVRFLAKGLAEADMLHIFYTSLAAFPGSTLDKLGDFEPLSQIKRRSYEADLKPYTKMWPWRELGRMFAPKIGLPNLTAYEKGIFSVDAVYQSQDKYVAKQLKQAKKDGVEAVYAYEDGALATFQQAKELGLKCIYDLPIAYWATGEKLLEEEADRYPQWAGTLEGIQSSKEKLQRKTKEFELADLIVTPGNFVANSLPKTNSHKQVAISPFGTPSIENYALVVNNARRDVNRPLRVLFVGEMGQRKGLADLFEAIKLLNKDQVELVALGSLREDLSFYKNQLPSFTYEPTRSHSKVLELMRSCDVFCLPSIVEGRAQVMQEAMSQGLPIIITPNTGGEDLVIEGETGFLVPIRSPKAIAEKISWFADNRHSIKEMGMLAQKHAASYTWNKYAQNIVNSILKLSL